MSYKTLYRVYRPQTFDEVQGQEHIIQTLRHAVSENKIAHAYLFCGPRGTGKTTVAKLLAKAINCTGDDKPCDQCENCIEIANGTHPDVIEIDAASNNGVDEVRNLIDKVKYAPTKGRYKVYIIDEVHMMSTGAFNALLKTLEEPPAHVVFILATTEPHKILPTIISRCQRYDFKKISIEDIITRMSIVVSEEGYECDREALELIAKLADGGMRDALSILEQCLAFNNNHLSVNDVQRIYGIVSLEDKINFIKIMISKNMKEALLMLEHMKMNGTDVKRLTYDLIDILKDIVIFKNTQDSSILFTLSPHYLNMIVPYIDINDVFSFIDILLEASEKYSRISNQSIYFEVAIIKMCNVVESNKKMITDNESTIDDILENQGDDQLSADSEIVELENNSSLDSDLNNTDVPVFDYQQPAPMDSSVTNDIIVDMDDIMNILVQAKKDILISIQERWPIIHRYLSNLNMAKCASMLCDSQVVAACQGAFIITFEHQPEVNAVNYYRNYKHLSAFVKEILGEEYMFLALQHSKWLSIRSRYIELLKQHALPTPMPLRLSHLEGHLDEENKLNEAQQFAVDLFGDIVELEED